MNGDYEQDRREEYDYDRDARGIDMGYDPHPSETIIPDLPVNDPPYIELGSDEELGQRIPWVPPEVRDEHGAQVAYQNSGGSLAEVFTGDSETLNVTLESGHILLSPVPASDMINHPPHYTGHPSGVECITITQHMGFNLGNALKYIWRADLKADAVSDLLKAIRYIEFELVKRGAINDRR